MVLNPQWSAVLVNGVSTDRQLAGVHQVAVSLALLGSFCGRWGANPDGALASISWTDVSCLLLTIVVGLQKHLEQAERTTCEVQQDVTNAPAFRALPAKVHVGLRGERQQAAE